MKIKTYICGTACVLIAMWMGVMPVWAGFTKDEAGQISYLNEQGNPVKKQWIYQDEKNEWYYLKEDGYCALGKFELSGDTYFFDENGKMLTGWVEYKRNEIPESFTGTIDGEDIYYCNDDGKMARGWVEAYSPETKEYEDSDVFQEVQENSYHRNRYYFKENGKICRNAKKRIDDKQYLFDSNAVCVKGWIYDYGEGAADRYLQIDTNSSDGDKALCRENPENLMYGLSDDGSLAAKRFVDAIPAWDNDGDDVRSFFIDSSGYIVTADGGRGNGSKIVARKKFTKIKEPGRYQLEDSSTDVNVTKIDGKYYCIEDSGTRMDGVAFLTGEVEDKDFRDGIYGFTDHAAMQTGAVTIENKDGDDEKDGYYYYYYFAEKDNEAGSKGHGITGVEKNKLYYQGLAVGAQMESLEVVYLPTLEEQDYSGYGTGFFLVDEAGRVKKGSKSGSTYTSSDGKTYKVYKDNDRCDKYGYRMEYCNGDKDEDGKKIWYTLSDQDYAYLCWDAVEE